MEVKVLRDQKQFLGLKEAWKNLQSLGAVKDITTTWEWMSTWWEVFNEDKNLAVLVVRDNDEVIGIAPFMQRKVKYFRLIPIKNFRLRLIPYMRMEFIASGDDVCSDYLSFIVKEGREKEVLKSVFKYLCNSRDTRWDELVLYQMNAESTFIPLLYDLANELKLNIKEIDRDFCPYVNLPDSFEDYLSQLGQNTRYQIRQGMRKLNEKGDAVFKIAKTEEEIELAKTILIRLHQSRWTQKGEPGRFSSDEYKLFHDKMISIAHKENWLRLSTLFFNQKPIACIYNFCYGNKIYFYQSGIEISDDRDLRYGMLAHIFAISYSISEAAKEYDFLAGVSDYKTRLAKEQHEIVTIRISKLSTKESLYKIMCYLRKQMIIVRNSFVGNKGKGK